MEFQKDNSFFVGRFKSIGFAFNGCVKLIKTEHSIMVQSFVGLVTICLGFYFDISKEEWMFQALALGLVLSVESLNTAAEKIADFIHPDYHKRIGFIKDIAAGAVFFAAMAAITIWSIIYLPRLF